MPENKEKRVYSGYYTRYDGAQIFVVTTATDADMHLVANVWRSV